MTAAKGASMMFQGTKWGKARFGGCLHCYLGTRPNKLQHIRDQQGPRGQHMTLRTFYLLYVSHARILLYPDANLSRMRQREEDRTVL